MEHMQAVARYYDHEKKEKLDPWLKVFEEFLEGKVSREALDKEMHILLG
jgi:hypothetical protein